MCQLLSPLLAFPLPSKFKAFVLQHAFFSRNCIHCCSCFEFLTSLAQTNKNRKALTPYHPQFNSVVFFYFHSNDTLKHKTMEVSSLSFLLLLLCINPNWAQNLVEDEARTLFRIRRILQEPEAVRGWNKWTNFCTIHPSPSLAIACSNDHHLTELTITGTKNSTFSPTKLSPNFSTTSFFNTLSRFPNLKLLSLVSLGIWGSIPPEISRLSSLKMLNLTSNYINGRIPSNITLLKNITHLLLSENLIEGSIPDLRSMEELQELDLSQNKLDGEFPSISNSIVDINLRNNSMRSKLPSDLSTFSKLLSIDISSNHFVGLLPPQIFSLPSIQYLDMSGNRLTGTLSRNITCRGGLHFVDISNNLLTGELPVCLVKQGRKRVVNCEWNCLQDGDKMHQHQPYFCNRGAVAVLPIREDDDNNRGVRMKLWVVVATIGAAAVMVAIVSAYLKLRGFKSSRKMNHGCSKGSGRAVADGGNSTDELKTFTFPGTMRSVALGLPPYRIFSLEEIEEATNHFHPSTLTSQTSVGKLYRGWLRNGAPVTVRRMRVETIGKEWLTQYIEHVSKLRHENLISVLGHCCIRASEEEKDILMVVERVGKGSLGDHLSDSSKREVLKWPQRMGMMMGIAKGIQFLHTGITPGIFGNDLNANLIVLDDDNLTPKISGYNMPISSSSSKYIQGRTKRPEDEDGGRGADLEKHDVYQVGRLMVELIIGKVLSSVVEVEKVKRHMEKNHNWGEVVDPVMEGTFAHQSVRNMVEVAIKCVGEERGRPSMEDILWNMHYSCQIQDAWSSSNLNSTV